MVTILRRALLVMAMLLPATTAFAQMSTTGSWFVAPTVGVNGGASTTISSAAVGIAGGWMGSKRLGAEGELAFTPGFFEQDGFRITRRMRTFMGNAVYSLRWGNNMGLQPYVVGGAGMVSPRITEAGEFSVLDTDEFGFDVGGGAMWFKRNVGVRGDVRYFRMMGDDTPNAFGVDLSKLGFWRVSTGLAVRF